ncbi:hypothetical protein BsWGS_22060 [Bradybaena similaris]
MIARVMVTLRCLYLALVGAKELGEIKFREKTNDGFVPRSLRPCRTENQDCSSVYSCCRRLRCICSSYHMCMQAKCLRSDMFAKSSVILEKVSSWNLIGGIVLMTRTLQ